MTDQQPADPAAGAPDKVSPPDPTRVGKLPAAGEAPTAGAGVHDETRAQGEQEPPARWSGSAAVPEHVPKRPRWSLRRNQDAAGDPAPPVDPWADSEDWSATPAVDPWADQDTPWQAELPFPEAMPPTRIDSPLPPTRMQAPLPPTRTEPPLPPTRTEPPLPPTTPQNPAGLPAVAAPPVAPAGSRPRRRGWGRKNRAEQPAQVNRLPIQPRPPAPAPPAPAPPTPAPPAPAPPPWAPPPWAPSPGRPAPGMAERKGPPPAPRRKRRWPRRLFLFTLVTVACCCGVPGYLGWPAARQYPVSAVMPQSVADLDLRDDGAGRRAVERLSEQLSGTSLVQGDVFAGVYADGDGKRVTVFGATGLRLTPEADVEAEIAHLAGDYDITGIEPYDLGETGVHERCGVGRSGGKTVVVCTWADHGSLATVLLTRRSVPESAELTGLVRSAVLTRG